MNEQAKRKAKILIVDDHPIVRQGMAQLINLQDDLELCCEKGDARGALEAMRACRHELAIVDISLPGVSGLDLVKNLTSHYPTVPILVISMYAESVYATRALRAGAKGYIVKQEATQTILAAIRQILKGGAYLSPAMQGQLLKKMAAPARNDHSLPVSVLSDKEYEVFRLIGLGLATSQIAKELSRSVKTIEAHRSNIKSKLRLTNSGQLVNLAVQWVSGDVEPSVDNFVSSRIPGPAAEA